MDEWDTEEFTELAINCWELPILLHFKHATVDYWNPQNSADEQF